MDFGAGSADNIHFYYVLPFSPRSALVETTIFPKRPSIDQYETELRHYLQHRYGLARWQIKHTEQGVLPMENGGNSVPSAQIVTPLRWACTGVQLSRLPDIVFLTLTPSGRAGPLVNDS